MEIREKYRYRGVFGKVPGDPSRWRMWERMGRRLVQDFRRQMGGLPTELVCREGEKMFPRYFQLLAPGGTLTFKGALEGVHFTFMGKRGALSPGKAFEKAGMGRGETVLIHYGADGNEKVDPVGMDAIESALDLGGILVVATQTEEQRHFVERRWFGQVADVFSLEEMIQETEGFDWPSAMPVLPDPADHFQECQEALSLFHRRTVKPFCHQALSGLGRETQREPGFDLVFERAGQDTLGISIHLVRPNSGRVVYGEEMANRRYSFYAPQVWMNRKRIVMPSAVVVGEASTLMGRKPEILPKEHQPSEVEQMVRRLEPVGTL